MANVQPLRAPDARHSTTCIRDVDRKQLQDARERGGVEAAQRQGRGFADLAEQRAAQIHRRRPLS